MKKLTACVMAILLTTLSISCVTEKVIEKKIVPELYFPRFPKMEVLEKLDNGVMFSNESVLNLAEYSILIEETEKNYNEIKEMYDETE